MKKELREWIEDESATIHEALEGGSGPDSFAAYWRAIKRFTAGKDSAKDRDLLAFQIEGKLGAGDYDDNEDEKETAEAAFKALKAKSGHAARVTVNSADLAALVAACDDLIGLAETFDDITVLRRAAKAQKALAKF